MRAEGGRVEWEFRKRDEEKLADAALYSAACPKGRSPLA